MAKKKQEISIIVAAKNAVAAGLSRAHRAIKGFGSRVGGIFRKAFKPLASARAQLMGLVVSVLSVGKALKTWAETGAATRSLTAALEGYGEAADKLLPRLQKIAAAIQDETGINATNSIQLMASMRTMGVHTDRLGDATRAVYALVAAGMRQAQASRTVVRAMQGQYNNIERFLPALKLTTDEAERARMVNDFLSRGYQQQREMLKTTSGAWRALRERMSDAVGQIGRAIDQSIGIREVLERAAEAAKGFGEAISRWIDGEAFSRIQTDIQSVVNALRSSEGQRDMLQVGGDYLKSVFDYGLTMLKEGALFLGRQIEASIQAGLPKMLGGSRERAESIRDSAAHNLRWAAIGAADRLATAGVRFRRELEKWRPDEAVVSPQAVERVDLVDEAEIAAKRIAEAEVEAERLAKEGRLKELEELLREKERIEAEMVAAEREGHRQAFESEKEAAEKSLALARDLAGKRVNEFIAEQKQQRNEARAKEREDARDQRRADRYRARLDAGERLGRREREWLAAFDQIRGAQARVDPLREQIRVAESNLRELANQTRSLQDIGRSLTRVNATITSLMELQ